MSSSIRQLLRFGPFELDRAARTLRRDGGLVPLPPKAFDLLVVLLESHGAVVDKSTLMQRLWPDTFVEEGNLPVTVFAMRSMAVERQRTSGTDAGSWEPIDAWSDDSGPVYMTALMLSALSLAR